MYTGTMIEELIATVERAESWAVEPAESLQEEDFNLPVAYLLEPFYDEQLVEVA
jgi:hypothetical protein